MSKLNLQELTGSSPITIANSNFQAIADELQNRVLYRDNPVGEDNTVKTNVDVNGKVLYNIGSINTQELYIDGKRVIPEAGVIESGAIDPASVLYRMNNLSDLQSVSSSRANLGLGNVNNTSDINKPVSTAMSTALSGKQNTLVSGTSIKTVNGNSLLGSGDLIISGGGGGGSSTFQQAGTGAVTRTMQNKVREIFSVKDFGAVGDAVANDTAAFQAALNAISAGGDDCVLEIPSGTYSLEGNLVYNSANRLTVRGMGMPRLHFKDASLADHWSITSSQSFRMRDLEIQFTPPASNGVRVGLKINAGGDHSHVLSNIRIGILINDPARTIVAFDIINPSLSSFTDVYVRADHGGASSGPVAGQNLIAFTCTATNKISTDSIFQSCTVIGFEIAWTVFPPILNPVGLALEGIAWRDCTVVGCVGGVYIQGNSSNAYKSPFWRWYGGHISTTKYIFKCIWVAQILITNGYFYVTYTAGVTDAQACLINQCQDVKIENNFMYLLSAPVGFAFTGFYAGTGSQRVNTIDNSLVGANATTTLVSSGAGSSYSYAKGNRKVVTVGGSPGITVSFGGTYDMDMGDNVSIVDGSAPAVPPQGGLLLAGGYSRGLMQVGENFSSATPTITFPIAFKAGTTPAVFFSVAGTPNTMMESLSISSLTNTGFEVQKKQFNGSSIVLSNYQIFWQALGEPA